MKTKRLLCVLLCAVLLCGLLPSVALADSEEHSLTYEITGRYFSNPSYFNASYAAGTPLSPIDDDMEIDGYFWSGWSGLPETMPDEAVTVTGHYELARTSISVYSLYTNPEDDTLHLGSRTEGYSKAPAARPVIVKNTGNQSVTVELPDSDYFDIYADEGFSGGKAVLAARGDSAVFYVRPMLDLDEDEYLETLVVFGNGGVHDTIDVLFNVYADEDYSVELENYTLTFETNGGSDIRSIVLTEGRRVDLTEYTPKLKGCIFTGWYDDRTLSNQITDIVVREDTTVYAGWKGAASMGSFTLGGTYSGYNDVDECSWYGSEHEGAVRAASLLGIMEGDGNRLFRPDDGITRAEVIKMAAVIHNVYNGGKYTFYPSDGSGWYNVYIDYAIRNGIISYADFDGDYARNATRAEMAYVLARALPESELQAISSVTPPDVSRADKYGNEIYLLYAAGVLQGSDDSGTLDGWLGVTRAQAAAMISRLCIPLMRID